MRLLNLALVAVLWIGSAVALPGLPARIPRHVGTTGITWTDATALSWFLLPAVATATLLLVRMMAGVIAARPRWLNIPGKERLLALPPERQAPVLRRAIDMMHGTITVTLLIFIAVQYGLWHTARGGSADTMLVLVLPLAVLSTPLVLGIWLPRVSEELERQVSEHRAAGGTVPE